MRHGEINLLNGFGAGLEPMWGALIASGTGTAAAIGTRMLTTPGSMANRWSEGIGLLIGLMHVPPIVIMALSGFDLVKGMSDGVGTQAAALFLQLVFISLLLWRVAAEGQLLRHALELPLLAAMTIATTLLIVEVWILTTLFP